MQALSKFIGGCVNVVNLSAENMLVKIELSGKMEGVNKVVNEQFELLNNNILMPQVLKMVGSV